MRIGMMSIFAHLCPQSFSTMLAHVTPVNKYSVNEQINKCNHGEQVLINHRLYKPFAQTPGQSLLYTKNVFAEKFKAKPFSHCWRTLPLIVSSLKNKSNKHSP